MTERRPVPNAHRRQICDLLHPARTAERKRVDKRGRRHRGIDPDGSSAGRAKLHYCPVCMMMYPEILCCNSCCGHYVCYECACAYAARHCALPTSTHGPAGSESGAIDPLEGKERPATTATRKKR